MNGHHEDLSRAHDVKSSSNRNFGLWLGGALAIYGLAPMIRSGVPRIWALLAGAIFLLAAATFPKILSPLNSLWTKFGLLLGRVMNPIITGLIFFLVVTPAGLLIRLLGKDLLRLRPDPASSSYWIRRDPPGPEPASMSRQF